MSQIGNPIKKITVAPLESPVPAKETAPVKEKEKIEK